MENSPPPAFNKPDSNDYSELIDKVEIQSKLVFNNKNYDLEIGFNKNKTEIIFLIDEEGKFSSEYYSTNINLESFLKLSKYFRLCDSIEEAMGCMRTVDKKLKKKNQKYKTDFNIKNNEAELKYNIPIPTEEKINFVFLLKKIEKNKDLIIKKLKERIKDLEDGYYGVKKLYENELQNKICQSFQKIRNELNKKELELFKKFEELNKKKPENLRLNDDFIKKINDVINDISITYDNFDFKWKNGPNYSLNENKLIATKTSGGADYNCIILGDETLPKNSIVSWKIKLKNFPSNIVNFDWDMLIGIGPENLNQNKSNPYNSCWTFLCASSQISIKAGNPTTYKTGKLKTNDIVEVKMDTSKGILSFGVNGVDYGIACENIPVDNLCPVVIIRLETLSIELIETNFKN